MSEFRRRLMMVGGGGSPTPSVPYGIININEIDAENYYIKTDGVLAPYNGESTSPFYDVTGFSFIGFSLPENRYQYSSFYNSEYQWICNLESLRQNHLEVPQNAKYVRFSAQTFYFSANPTSFAILYNIGTGCTRTVLDTIDIPNSYLENGVVTSYNGYGISPFVECNYVGLFAGTNPNNSNYTCLYNEGQTYIGNYDYNSVKYQAASPNAHYFRTSAPNNYFSGNHFLVSYDVENVEYVIDTIAIPNKYLTGNGGEASYSGWGISPYYPIPQGSQVAAYTNGMVNSYCEYYDANKVFLGRFNADVPSGAAYARFSFANASFDGRYSVRFLKYNILNQ